MQLSCEHCLWWQHEPAVQGAGSEDGTCHRFPPSRNGFPAVSRSTFCGEFTPRTYASVARMAGAAQMGATPLGTPIEGPASYDRDIDGETAAAIAAAVAMVIPGPHRVLDVQPVSTSAFGPWPVGAVLNTWAVEGRVQQFSMRKVR